MGACVFPDNVLVADEQPVHATKFDFALGLLWPALHQNKKEVCLSSATTCYNNRLPGLAKHLTLVRFRSGSIGASDRGLRPFMMTSAYSNVLQLHFI